MNFSSRLALALVIYLKIFFYIMKKRHANEPTLLYEVLFFLNFNLSTAAIFINYQSQMEMLFFFCGTLTYS